MAARAKRKVDGQEIAGTHTDKVMYPATGFTKGEVLDYYERIAPIMIPYLTGRAVTLKRFPDGVSGEVFYQKHCPKSRPPGVHTAPIWTETSHREVQYCVLDDAGALLWAANLAALELHVSLSLASALEVPTSVIFDLDPGPPAGMLQCLQVALLLRDQCERWGLQLLPKLSGSKGLHLHIPLNSKVTYDESKPFAQELADRLATDHSALVVDNMRREQREGRVLVDWSQNDTHKTTVCVYSLRGRDRPTISAPITWDEIAQAVNREEVESLRFEPDDLWGRLDRLGDLYRPLRELQQKLPR